MDENQSSNNHKRTSRELNLIRTTWSGWCGVVYIFVWIFLLRGNNVFGSEPYQKCVGFMLGLFLSMGACEAWLLGRSGHGLLVAPWQRFHMLRLVQKVVGWIVTYVIVCIPYWLFPEYHGSFYDPYYHALSRYAPLWILFFTCNIVVDDLKSESPTSDVYYLIGHALFTLSLSDFRTPLSQQACKQTLLRSAHTNTNPLNQPTHSPNLSIQSLSHPSGPQKPFFRMVGEAIFSPFDVHLLDQLYGQSAVGLQHHDDHVSVSLHPHLLHGCRLCDRWLCFWQQGDHRTLTLLLVDIAITHPVNASTVLTYQHIPLTHA